MNERPILFSGSMVEAILDGRKTQTRRVIHPQPDECIWFDVQPTPYRHVINPQQPNVVHKNIIKCPYGKVGDSLWVRETWTINSNVRDGDSTAYYYRASCGRNNIKWRPSIFMPREASRITLEITDVRVERLQDISEKDALAEGVLDYEVKPQTVRLPEHKAWRLPQVEFQKLWDSINKKRDYGWNSNPWVWVIEFRQVSNEPA